MKHSNFERYCEAEMCQTMDKLITAPYLQGISDRTQEHTQELSSYAPRIWLSLEYVKNGASVS